MVQLKDLAPAGIAFVVIAITLSIGAEILQDIEASATQNTTVDSVYQNGTAGLAEIAGWLPTLGLVLAAAVVIGSVVAFFAFRN